MKSIYFIFIVVMLFGCAPATTSMSSTTSTTFLLSETPTIAPLPTATDTNTSLIPTPIAPPPPIEFASVTYDRVREELVSFGGEIPNQCFECNATWTWDGITWTQRQPQNSPLGRIGAGFVYDDARQNAILFGSPSQLPSWLNDTWVWDGQNWIEKHPSLSPSPRSGAVLVYDPDHKVVILFGGRAPDPSNSRAIIAFNETWIWDGNNWTQAHPKDSPPAPQGVPWTMGYDNDHHYTILYEGTATWTWDGSNWAEQHTAHSPEAPFYGVMSCDENNQQLVFIGQTLDKNTQTWVWDGIDWTQVKTQLQLNFGSQPHLFFDTKFKTLLLYVVNNDKSGVTGFSMWMWKSNNWTKIY